MTPEKKWAIFDALCGLVAGAIIVFFWFCWLVSFSEMRPVYDESRYTRVYNGK